MVTDFNNSKDIWSTGNRLKDYGIGAAVGLGNLFNSPGQYYVQANYKGQGLADTGLGYLQNQRYQNPYDQAALLTSMLSGDKGGFIKNIFGNKNISDGGMTLEDIKNADNIFGGYGLNTQGYNIPKELGFLGPNIVGRPSKAVSGSSYDYSLPTTSYDMPSWLGGK